MSRPPGLHVRRALPVAEGSAKLIHERLELFRTAFRTDPRPGLVFEFGRLVFANEAAKRLLRPSEATDTFLGELMDSFVNGLPCSNLHLQKNEGRFVPLIQPARIRPGQAIQICFLVREPGLAPILRVLSERELDVLKWLMRGLTNKKIGERLGISVETVRKHVSHALKKTRSKSRAVLVRRAFRAGSSWMVS